MYPEHFANIWIGSYPMCPTCDGYGHIMGLWPDITDDGTIKYSHYKECPDCAGHGYLSFKLDKKAYKRHRRFGYSRRFMRAVFILGKGWKQTRERLYKALPKHTVLVERIDKLIRYKISPLMWLLACQKEPKSFAHSAVQ